MKKKVLAGITAGSGLVLTAAKVAFAQGAQRTGDAISEIKTGSGYATDAGALISFILRLVLAIGALLVFAYLILGGIEYITSGGEKGKTESARNKITSAVVGLIILAASWAILNLALRFLGLTDLTNAINNVGNIQQTP